MQLNILRMLANYAAENGEVPDINAIMSLFHGGFQPQAYGGQDEAVNLLWGVESDDEEYQEEEDGEEDDEEEEGEGEGEGDEDEDYGDADDVDVDDDDVNDPEKEY